MPDTSVKFFDSTMLDAPVLSGTVGALVALLDACLVNGFSTVSVTSIVIASNIATVTTAAGHGFAMVGLTGPVVTIAGATPAGLNVQWRIASVTNTTVFTFVTTGISDQTATGTITVQRSGAGWTKPYSGTNQAVYRQGAGGTEQVLQVIDDANVTTAAAGRWAKWTGYESMTSVTDGTAPFPTVVQAATGLQVMKSNLSDASARFWGLIADANLFYLVIGWSTAYTLIAGGYAFGWVGSMREADAYATLIVGETAGIITLPTNPGLNNNFPDLGVYTATQGGKYVARSNTQLGSAQPCGFLGAPGPTVCMGNAGFTYPYPLNNGTLISSVGLVESTLIRQSVLPGLYYPQHAPSFEHNNALDGITGLTGRTLRCQALANAAVQAQCLIDITGPWVR